MLLDRIGFYCSGLHGIVDVDGTALWEPVIADAPITKWLVVVGRQHYFETVRDYPIGNRNDVNSVLKNEPWRFPHAGLRLNKIARLSTEAHRVTSWIIKPEVFHEIAGRPLWVVPESACFTELKMGQSLAHERFGGTVFIAMTPDGLTSSCGQQGAFEQRVGTHKLSAENEQDRPMLRISGSHASDAMLRGLFEILRVAPLRFFNGIQITALASYSWGKAAKLSAIMCAVYLLVTSLYLSVAITWVDYRLESDRLAAEKSLSNRAAVILYRQKIDEIRAAVSKFEPLWVTWDIFLDLKAMGTQFRAVNSSRETVTLYLTAPRATSILDWLSRDERVVSAEFARPVRNVRGFEEFAVKITLRNVAAVIDGDVKAEHLPELKSNRTAEDGDA